MIPSMDAKEIKRFDNTQLENHLGLQIITDHIDEALVLADGSGELIDFNPAAVRLHGFKTKEEVFAVIHDYPNLFELYYLDGTKVPFEDWPLIRILRGETIKDLEVKLLRKDVGSETVVSYGGTPIFKDGKLTLAVMHIRDISEKKKFELELKKAIRARDEFLSLASHELRTPLTSLNLLARLQAELAAEHGHQDHSIRIREIAGQMDKNVDRLGRLVEEMFDVSRIQNKKLKIRREKFELLKLVSDTVERMHGEFLKNGNELPIIRGNESSGMWDQLRIEQVIVNLLTNAIRYGKSKPILIELTDLPDKTLLKVKDHGIGISASNFDRIFDPFERVEETNSGLGVGLYISKQIVLTHNGRIWVESKLGQGSEFFVELPKA